MKITDENGPDATTDEKRRQFLKGGALAGVAALAAPASLQAQQRVDTTPSRREPPAPDPAAETAPAMSQQDDPNIQPDCGSDYMVDVFRALGLEYIAINPASSVRGLQESIINYGGNKPELLTVVHEEIGVAMAQGYAKVTGKPMGVLAHGTVGLQHASMGLYNAYCDQMPVYMLIGNTLDSAKRGVSADWQHTAQDPAAFARDFLKWDDQPNSLTHFGESAVRAYQMAMTPPLAPVLLSIDQELQENAIPGGRKPPIPKLPRIAPVTGDSAAILEIAKLLVRAENPVLIADRMARTQAGMDSLVELAELLQCAVIDQGARTNFPTLHPLNQGRQYNLHDADLIVGLELSFYWQTLNSLLDRIERRSVSKVRDGVKTVHITARALFMHSNYQEFGRYQSVDILVPADAESSLPALIEACRRLIGRDDKRKFAARGAALAAASRQARETARSRASIGWDSRPITAGRLLAELWAQIKNEDWSLVGQGFHAPWQKLLWKVDRVYQLNGYSGGWGLGYNLPGALGGALANKAHGRISVATQGDGDFMYCPGTLWTAAHHRIPILYVMHNNRSYHTELMHVQKMANRINRGIRNANTGNVLTDPNIDFAGLAKSMGVYAEGPIEDPAALGPALERALAVVKQGLPALVDVICDGQS